MNLYDSLGLVAPIRIAVVGAGGKTTAVFAIARQVNGRAWVTTTTHLGTDQLDLADRHFTLRTVSDFHVDSWLAQKVTLLTGDRTPDDRVSAPESALMGEIVRLADDHKVSLIVEADGARSHPIKAPGEHEPVIPTWADAVIIVVGLSALGKPLTAAWVHRSEQFARLSGIRPGDPVTLEGTIKMLLDPLGGLKGIQPGRRKVVLFNQRDVLSLGESELALMRDLRPAFDRVLVAALANQPDDITIIS